MEDISEPLLSTRFQVEKIISYLERIFKEIPCSGDHSSSCSCICLRQECKTGLLCSECLLSDLNHSERHRSSIIPITEMLKRILVDNMQEIVLNDSHLLEVEQFCDTFMAEVTARYKVRGIHLNL